ncbi:MAG: glycosyltransferase [Chloroflexota bacterium]|nr:glycosyltransferase [Chloroflexota bacterium]
MLYISVVPPELSIVIVSWNVYALLAGCLRALPSAAGDRWSRTEVIVVDNASWDSSVARVRQEFPTTRMIALPKNRGFSAGNNAGILASRGKYILLLNPDTVPLPSAIDHMAAYLDEHPDVGIVGPRLLNSDDSLQPSRRCFPTLLTALVESTPLQQLFPHARVLRHFYMVDTPENEPQFVGWLSGAALLCRREALMQAGLFDPGYFMFSEEVDLCRRVTQAGWDVAYLPDAEVIHFGGESTGQDVAARHINFNTSKVRYFRLHNGIYAGKLIRLYLMSGYVGQLASEAAKWILGHKRPLRHARLVLYSDVLKSRLRVRRAVRAGVLLLTGEYPPARGGVGDYTCQLSRALAEQGFINRVLTLRKDILLDASGMSGSIGVESRPSAAAEMRPEISTSVQPLETKRVTLGSVLRALRGSRLPICHIQYQTAAYDMRPLVNVLPLLLRAFSGSRVVVTFHDLRVPYLFPKAGPLRKWAVQLLARSAHVCVTTNPIDAKELRGWGVSNIHLIPIGSNISNNPPPGFSRSQWRLENGISPDTTLLSYFGFLNNSKGLDDLLRTLPLLADRGNFRLLMIGGGVSSSDPTDRQTASGLQRLAAELGVADRMLWTGYLSPQGVSAALLSSDMALLPYADGVSFRRGSLLAVLEHGLPLVTTDPQESRSPSDHIWPRFQDGENALLVPPGDIGALATAVEEIASDKELAAKLREGSRALSIFFSWKIIAQKHKELYSNIYEGMTSD